MRYKKVRPNPHGWLKWLYSIYFSLLFILVGIYALTQKIIVLSGVAAMVLIGVMFIATARRKIVKTKNISCLIHQHIKENELCKIELRGNREIYIFYPEVCWRADKEENMLHIRFRLTGNKVNLRGLEQGLEDRLEKRCLNVFEERGIIEYVFELEPEKQLVIASKDDIKGNMGDTKITLSPSFVWDYRTLPHFLVAGTTGSGKTTFIRFLISSLINRGVRVVYIDIKRDSEMERYCKSNSMIHYAYDKEDIAKTIQEVTEELKSRSEDIERIGIGEDFDYGFNPVFLICDEIILMKLLLQKKLYDEITSQINAIIVGGRSKAIFCGLVTQSGLAEYFGNSGIRSNLGLRVALGQMTQSELGMIFGNEFSDVKNLRYGQIGSGLAMRNGIDSRPREFVAPYIKKGVLD